MEKSEIAIIAALDSKRGIGKQNGLLFKIPGDLKRFKELTLGHPIIMGRKTFESIGRILPGRTNIIITRDLNYQVEGGVIVHSLDEAIRVAEDFGQARMTEASGNVIFIIGGGEIFSQAIDRADKLYLTLVEGDFGADTFFPDYSQFTKKVSEETHESEGYTYTYLNLEK